jgi:hypothetical protein
MLTRSPFVARKHAAELKIDLETIRHCCTASAATYSEHPNSASYPTGFHFTVVQQADAPQHTSINRLMTMQDACSSK